MACGRKVGVAGFAGPGALPVRPARLLIGIGPARHCEVAGGGLAPRYGLESMHRALFSLDEHYEGRKAGLCSHTGPGLGSVWTPNI